MEERKASRRLWWAVLFWLLVWQIGGMAVGESLLLASPLEVLKTLWDMVQTSDFWKSAGASSVRIAGGFLLAVVIGGALACLGAVSQTVQTLLKPLMLVVSSVPVASFIILALLWLKNVDHLAILISFLMVLPMMYANMLQGICSTDGALLEMGGVYRLTGRQKARWLYLPSVWTYFQPACRVGLGICWKSGVAAEVIGITGSSMGGALHTAKLYFETAQVMGWTVVIVLVSGLFERLFLALASHLYGALLRVPSRVAKKSAAPPSPKDIALAGVDVAYGGQTVLRDVHLRISAGETVFLMGASGLGKTSLLRLILGRMKPSSGEVKTGEQRFGCVFQENRLVPQITAVENVRLACPGVSTEEVTALFAQMGLPPEAANKLPAELSGGQKRRVTLARALLSDSDCLVLDEPFTGLDAEARALCQQVVLSHKKERTLLCVTHSPEEAAELGGKVIQLKDFA